jgi:hypothetical protein
MTSKKAKWWESDPTLKEWSTGQGIGADLDALGEYLTRLEELPLPDMKKVSIYCPPNNKHGGRIVVESLIVQYVRGQRLPPRMITGEDLVRYLIRDQDLLEEGKLMDDFDQEQEFPYLTKDSQNHLANTGQWREKVNIVCHTCKDNVPIKTKAKFLQYLALALDNKKYDLPISFFRHSLPSK